MKWNPPDVGACPPSPATATPDSSSDGFGTSASGSSGTSTLGSVCGAAKACANSTNRESVQNGQGMTLCDWNKKKSQTHARCLGIHPHRREYRGQAPVEPHSPPRGVVLLRQELSEFPNHRCQVMIP